MNKTNMIRYLVMILTMAFSFVIIVYGYHLYGKLKNKTCEADWYYINEANEKIDVTFPFQIKNNKNHIIYVEIPTTEDEYDILSFASVHQSVVVKLDDEILYEDNNENDTVKKFLISRKLHVINLPKDCVGKTLSVNLESSFYKYDGYFYDFQLGAAAEVINNIYAHETFSLILSIVIIFLNLSFIFANLLFYKAKKNSLSLIYMFLSGLMVGFWLLGDSSLATLYIDNNITHYISYISLLSFIVVLSLYLKTNIKNKVSNVFLVISIINLIIQCCLHLFKTLSFTWMLPINLIFILVLFVFYFVNLIMNIRKHKLEFIDGIELLFLLILCLITILNIVLSYLTNLNINSLIGIIYFMFLIVIYIKTIISIVKTAESSKVYKAKLRETRDYLIQSQMKPHFIFNTLGAIRTLIMSNPDVAYEMTTNFSKYLRANISTLEPGERISFSQELEHIKAYVLIEQQRFLNRIKVIYDIECEGFLIPPLSVEPLVENAIKHGVCKKINGGVVKITSKEYEDRYEVSVEDDGVGFDTEILQSHDNTKSVGLKYIILRLKELSNADFTITSEIGKGTKAVITIWK